MSHSDARVGKRGLTLSSAAKRPRNSPRRLGHSQTPEQIETSRECKCHPARAARRLPRPASVTSSSFTVYGNECLVNALRVNPVEGYVAWKGV